MLDLTRDAEIIGKIINGPHSNAVLRVWSWAKCSCDWRSGYILLTRAEIARKANITPDNVSRAMTILERYGAIIRYPEGGRTIYQVNPIVGWASGDAKNPGRGMSNLQRVMIGMHRLMKEAHEQETGRLAREAEEPALPGTA